MPGAGLVCRRIDPISPHIYKFTSSCVATVIVFKNIWFGGGVDFIILDQKKGSVRALSLFTVHAAIQSSIKILE